MSQPALKERVDHLIWLSYKLKTLHKPSENSKSINGLIFEFCWDLVSLFSFFNSNINVSKSLAIPICKHIKNLNLKKEDEFKLKLCFQDMYLEMVELKKSLFFKEYNEEQINNLLDVQEENFTHLLKLLYLI